MDTEPEALIHKYHYSTSTDLDKHSKFIISRSTRNSNNMVECEDACYKDSGIYSCDVRETLLESDKDHSKKLNVLLHVLHSMTYKGR